ncbi:MAG TPA: hypothetical protein VG734_15590 [Lacunisphaera sp.]|nr:hypothetical protein [Lacunisphaera sp.]
MKSFVRVLSLVLVLGLAGFQAGCTSSHFHARRSGYASNFEVVESSAKRPLTAAEMALLKVSVAEYLETKGATAKGDYYVKVYLGPDHDGVPADWVIVRFTRETDLRFSMLASYPSYSPGYNSYYGAYDYYPYGYDNYSRISFEYYPDPYYGSSYYFPTIHNRRHYDRDNDHDRDRDRDRDHGRDGDKDHNKDSADTGNRGRFKPIDPVGAPPQVNRNRGDNSTYTRSYQPRSDSTSQPDRQPSTSRSSSGGYSTRSDLHRHDRDSSPRSEATSYRPSAPSRSESYDRGSSSSSSSSYSPPSYSPPPSYSRSESSSSSSSSSSSNQSQREVNQAAAQRERLE